MLFNVTLVIIAGFTADAVSVPYLSGYHPTQCNEYAPLIPISLFHLSSTTLLSDLSVHHFGTVCRVSIVAYACCLT